MPMRWSVRLLLTALAIHILVAAGSVRGQSSSLCNGLVRDRLPRPMTSLPKPGLLDVVTDPQFGTRIRRISAVNNASTDQAIRPMYSTTSAWNADESLLILYEVGRGHRLHDGHSYKFLRYLDIAPADLEQVYWHTTNPDILHYVQDKTLIRYHVSSGTKQPLRYFEFCQSPVQADSHAFSSWSPTRLGLRCGGTIFVYDIESNAVIGAAQSSLAPPHMAPSGELAYFHGYVLDEQLRLVRRLDISEVDTHASLGLSSDGRDVYNGAIYDPGPNGSPVGSLVTHDMATGTWRVIVGPATGYPYPPSGTHISSLAYKRPGWAFVSIIGNPSGQGLLDNELLIANIDTGEVCRIAHHRAWGKNNTRLSQPYWAEPHVIPSPSGTRALFASDWGNGPTVDAYVVELPGYAPPAVMTVSVTTDRAVYRRGETISISLDFSNLSTAGPFDLYLGALLPDQQTVVFFQDWSFTARMGTVAHPAGWVPISRAVTVPQGFTLSLDDAMTYRWQQGDPLGRYLLGLFATPPSALSDNRIDPGDFLFSAFALVELRP